MSAPHAYRRDIDGLRALAILPVLFYHARVPGFTGGFVGVDVFFVISGFLITGILVREIDAGQFSLVRFYERRARRILPALLVMMAAVLVASAWFYLPGDFEGVPKSAVMALLFLSNVWYFTQTGYFGAAAETMPLLHCWSLAVEEQFYIVFPLLLRWGAGRSKRLRIGLVAGIAVVSFIWAAAKQASTDGFAFYMLPPRAWELFTGALLAMGAVPEARARWPREALAAVGLAAILGAVFGYDKATVFPGVSALAPVLGSALVLHCAPGTWVGRLLSSRLPVAVGLISYSLYLWHWPLIVFTEYARDTRLAGGVRIAVIAAAFAVAWASWRFVEKPFRDGRRFDQKRIFAWSAGGMALVGLAAAAMVPLGAWPSRFAPQVGQLADARDDFSPKRHACLSNVVGGDRPECNIGAPVAPGAVLWGDSHGVELAWVLGNSMGAHAQALMERTRGSCPPVIGYTVAKDPDCARFNDEVLARILRTPSIHEVYLAGFWANGLYERQGVAAPLTTTIERLRSGGKAVTVFGPVPPQSFDVPRRLAHAAAFGDVDAVEGASLADYRAGAGWFTALYPRWQAMGVRVIDPMLALRQGEATRLMEHGRPVYFDWHHLSLTGARLVIDRAGVGGGDAVLARR